MSSFALDLTVNVGAVIGALGLLATVATFLGSRIRDRRILRAQLIREHTNDFYADKGVAKLFYRIDNHLFDRWHKFAGTDDEIELIRLLDILNTVGVSVEQRALLVDDLLPTTLGYATVRVSNSAPVEEYLHGIRVTDGKRYLKGEAFRAFVSLSRSLKETIRERNSRSAPGTVQRRQLRLPR